MVIRFALLSDLVVTDNVSDDLIFNLPTTALSDLRCNMVSTTPVPDNAANINNTSRYSNAISTNIANIMQTRNITIPMICVKVMYLKILSDGATLIKNYAMRQEPTQYTNFQTKNYYSGEISRSNESKYREQINADMKVSTNVPPYMAKRLCFGRNAK
jgi:hypothetical protein